jgi:hypothetical protein
MLTPARSVSHWGPLEEVQCIIYYDDWEVGGPTAFLPGLQHTGTLVMRISLSLCVCVCMCVCVCVCVSLSLSLHSQRVWMLQVRAQADPSQTRTAKRCMTMSAAQSTAKEQY